MVLLARGKQKEWTPPGAAAIKQMWQECVDDMLEQRRNYWLNYSYFHGDQWIGWNDSSATVDVVPFSDTSDAKYRVTVNKVKPHTTAMIARLVRTPLGFEPRPAGVDSGALRTARIERQVLEAKHHRDDWELTRAELVQSTILGGVAAVCLEPSWEYDTEPITDMQTGETFYMPKRPAIKLTSLSAVEFGIEPGTRSARDAYWWIRLTTLTPRQARKRYKLDHDPSPDADTSATPMQRQLISARSPGRHASRTHACAVYVYYERPSEDSPGCVVHVIGGNVVEQSPWPFPFTDRLNLRTFVQTRMDGTWKGDTVFNDARQLQRTYNLVCTSINRHIGKADNARILMPIGSVLEGDDELTGEAAEIIRYDPSAGAQPSWMQAPQIPRWLREQKDDIEMELDELFSRHGVSRGIAPGDRNSGSALALLAEKDETPLGLFVGDQQRGWQAIAEMVLMTERHLMQMASQKLAKANLGELAVTDVLSQDGQEAAEQIEYRASDLSELPQVHVPIETVMPRSQAAVQDQMVRLAGVFPQMFANLEPANIANILQVPDQSAFAYVPDPQVALAEWENGRMAAGVDDDEVEVADWHDHDKHVTRHNALRASARYREAPVDVRNYIDLHIEAHAKLAQQQMMAQMQQEAAMAAPGQQLSLPMGGEAPPAPGGAPEQQPQGVPA